MSQKLSFLSPNVAIPVGEWRMGIFALNARVMEGHSEDYLVNSIAYWGSRAGLDVATNSMRPLNIDLQLGADPALPFGGWVRNTVPGRTAVDVFNLTNIPSMFSVQTAPGLIDTYLNNFQGEWAGGVVLADPRKWATSSSWLQIDVWYPAAAMWAASSPSADVLEERLNKIGCNLYRVKAPGVGETGVLQYKPPKGLIFLFHTGSTPKTLGDVSKAIGAQAMVLDLNDVVTDPALARMDALSDLGEEQLEVIAKVGKDLMDSASGMLEGAGTAFDILGAVLKYGPILVIGGVVAYGGYRAYKEVKRRRR